MSTTSPKTPIDLTLTDFRYFIEYMRKNTSELIPRYLYQYLPNAKVEWVPVPIPDYDLEDDDFVARNENLWDFDEEDDTPVWKKGKRITKKMVHSKVGDWRQLAVEFGKKYEGFGKKD